jgi:CRISPR type III-B/RAMP module-associated protein Cmr5
MKTLDQIRATNALQKADALNSPDGGNALSGYPSLIISNGLLATLAFSIDKKGKHIEIANAIAHHLANLGDGQNLVAPQPATAQGLRDKLAASDADHLRRCTAEALAYLAFLKRFARP